MGEDTLEMFFSKLEELNTLTKWFNKQGKAIVKKSAKPRKRSPNKGGNGKSGFSVPVRVAPSLARSSDSIRAAMRNRVWPHLVHQDKNLQCEENKSTSCVTRHWRQSLPWTRDVTNWSRCRSSCRLLVSVKKEVETDHAAPTTFQRRGWYPEKKRPEAAKPEAPKTKKLKKVA